MAARRVRLELRKILDILPHRYPFLMLDRVTDVQLGASLRGHKMVSANEPWCQGYFPERPVLPGVLILEALIQAGTVLAYASEPFDLSRNSVYVLGVDKAKFRRPVTPGDRLDLFVEVVQHRTNVWKLKGEATVEGALAAETEILASVVDRL